MQTLNKKFHEKDSIQLKVEISSKLVYELKRS
jgi:hypothetical protein